MPRITIYLNPQEWDALRTLAYHERRPPKEQAAVVIARAVGMFPPESALPSATAPVNGALAAPQPEGVIADGR